MHRRFQRRLGAIRCRRCVHTVHGGLRAVAPPRWSNPGFPQMRLLHTFRRGHRVMVQVQSTWFPLVDRNPQTFVEIPDARDEDFKKATQQVFHRKDAASGVELLVLH